MQRIYIVEDDENIRELCVYALKTSGFDASGFENGGDFFMELKKNLPSMVILDIMLPEEDGLTILKRLRSSPVTRRLPVIMVTARSSELDKVRGLDMGADDYMAKPFSVMELVSRINAVLRRTGTNEADGRLIYEEISLDSGRHAVAVGGNAVELTFKEYELLRYMMVNEGIVLSRDKIMETVWGFDFEGESRTVDMHIKTLRQKLGEAGKYIKTVRNVGYKLGE